VESRLAESDAGQQAVVSINVVSGSSFRHGTFDRLRVNQWTGECMDSFPSGGNPIQALECVRVLADRQNLRVANDYFFLTERRFG
jgi:hypothetical protein